MTVCDDGKADGEVVRLRGQRFVIGRTEGDLVLPHDELISTRHVEIVRQAAGGQWRWVVTDLQSTNGLYVRASRVALTDGAEFLVGRGRYRFESATATATADFVPDAPPSSTMAWGGPAPQPSAVLTELVPNGVGARVPLVGAEYWIGTDPSCAIGRAGDPFTEARHIRIHCDARGGWHAENDKSLNDLWLRVPQIVADSGCLFQIGEQRFRLQIG